MMPGNHGHVAILLSTYNGEAFLPELLASVIAQTHTDWTLLVRDDGSTDQTTNIVDTYASDEPRIRRVDDDAGQLGPAGSFMALLSHVKQADAFAFCDQDDVWYPQKLAWSLTALDELDHPLAAVATDAHIADTDLVVTNPSALAAHGVDTTVDLGRLFINNVAIGATMVGTPELARRATELAQQFEPRMHDWWCALVAAHGGRLGVLPKPTMKWRRHSQTVSGGTPPTVADRKARRLDSLRWSIAAARVLEAGQPPSTPVAATATGALAAVDPGRPGVGDLVRLRRAGVRAWSWDHTVRLFAAVALS